MSIIFFAITHNAIDKKRDHDVNGFWNRKSDSVVINKNHQTLYILEFKRSSDRNKDFLG